MCQYIANFLVKRANRLSRDVVFNLIKSILNILVVSKHFLDVFQTFSLLRDF